MKSNKKVELNTPYGGKLVDLRIGGSEREEYARRAGQGITIQVSPRVLCDLELRQPVDSRRWKALWARPTTTAY